MRAMKHFCLVALCILPVSLMACSSPSLDTGASTTLDAASPMPDPGIPDARAPSEETPVVDGGAPDSDSLLDAASAGPCPTALANESVYCQFFEGPATRVGAWTVRGEPEINDAGRTFEDSLQFWSAPRSRRMGRPSELYARVSGPLPVARVSVQFRFRPEFAPYASNGHHLAFVVLGDSTAAIVWTDYGKLDPSRAGTRGYALVHHILGTSTDSFVPIPTFVPSKVWSALELSLDTAGTARLLFDGVEAAKLGARVAPSTTASAGLGPYYTSSSGSPEALSGNVDDFVVRVSR